VSDLAYKYGLADELAVVMKQKFLEKEPRPSWRETPYLLSEYEAWLRREVEELLAAAPGEVMREAADVANLAAIYADVKRRGGQ
jgi:hypothetical protein